MDGRFFVNKTRKDYDIVFVGLDAPQELQTNRLYSLEFFTDFSFICVFHYLFCIVFTICFYPFNRVH